MSPLNERLSIAGAVVLALLALPCIDPLTLLDGPRAGAVELGRHADAPGIVPAALARTPAPRPPQRSCAAPHGPAA